MGRREVSAYCKSPKSPVLLVLMIGAIEPLRDRRNEATG